MVMKCGFRLDVFSALALLMKALASQLAQTTLYIFMYVPEKAGCHFIQQRGHFVITAEENWKDFGMERELQNTQG